MEAQNPIQAEVEKQIGNLVLQVITKDAIIAQLKTQLAALQEKSDGDSHSQES